MPAQPGEQHRVAGRDDGHARDLFAGKSDGFRLTDRPGSARRCGGPPVRAARHHSGRLGEPDQRQLDANAFHGQLDLEMRRAIDATLVVSRTHFRVRPRRARGFECLQPRTVDLVDDPAKGGLGELDAVHRGGHRRGERLVRHGSR